jgi:glycosyltransferase involved in cell wall biosynthesis
MRILKITESYAPFYEFGGPPVKVEALAKGLAERGHKVTVLSADWGFESRQPGERPNARRSPFGWVSEDGGVEAQYLPTWLRYRSLTWNPAVTRYCRARLDQFEIVHIFGLYDLLGPPVARACRERGIPYVVEPIGMFLPIVRSILLKRVYHRLWGARMLGGSSAVVATAEQELEELARGGIPRSKLSLRRNGVMVPRDMPARGRFRVEQGLPPDALVVLFLGRLSEKKSPQMLLEAFARLPARLLGREVRLVFAGPDESGMRSRLEQRSENLGVKARVRFAGALFGSAKWSAYVDSDVFVLPSQNENFGNTAAEAAACGTPVVITETCGVAPLLSGAAGIVVPHETSALAGAVQQVLSDAGLRARLSEGGRRIAGRLGWDEPLAAAERLYNQIAGSAHGRRRSQSGLAMC